MPITTTKGKEKVIKNKRKDDVEVVCVLDEEKQLKKYINKLKT